MNGHIEKIKAQTGEIIYKVTAGFKRRGIVKESLFDVYKIISIFI